MKLEEKIALVQELVQKRMVIDAQLEKLLGGSSGEPQRPTPKRTKRKSPKKNWAAELEDFGQAKGIEGRRYVQQGCGRRSGQGFGDGKHGVGELIMPMRLEQAQNVFDAAIERMTFILQNYDDFIINFSGGKDSMTCVLMMYEASRRLGYGKRIKVLFYDEEFVYPETLATVDRVFALPWVEGYKFAVQMDSEILLPDGFSGNLLPLAAIEAKTASPALPCLQIFN